jgi:hypothetical protein
VFDLFPLEVLVIVRYHFSPRYGAEADLGRDGSKCPLSALIASPAARIEPFRCQFSTRRQVRLSWLADVADGSIASVRVCSPYVRSYPDSDRNSDLRARRLSAISDQSALQRRPRHSITSSAVASSDGGIVRPSALAVLRLMISSYLVGA